MSLRRARQRPAVLALALLLLGSGLLAGGHVVWQLFGTDLTARRTHEALRSDLRTQWASDAPGADWAASAPGEVVGLLRIPRLGASYEVPVVAAFDDEAFERGAGWYRRGAEPGEVGNVVLAAHRITHGDPFGDLPELRAGDEVVVETRRAVYHYRMVDDGDEHEVAADEVWPLQPVPYPRVPASTIPVEPMITLITCAELFHTETRLVVRGVLTSAEVKKRRKGASVDGGDVSARMGPH